MWKQLTIGLILLSFLSCNKAKESNSDSDNSSLESGMKFDKTKWALKDGRDYPFRELMLEDIVYNDTIRTLDVEEISKLLGDPDRQSEGFFYYTVSQKRIGSWPVHTRSMVIKFTNTSTIEWIKIHE